MNHLTDMFGYYINLDTRQDRKEHMNTNIVKRYPFFKNLERVRAVYHRNGALGCALSHQSILEAFLNKDEEMVMIVEDDLVILNEVNFMSFSKDFESIRTSDTWDIIVFTPRGDRVSGNKEMTDHRFQRIRNNQTTTGYIVKRGFAEILLNNIKESIQLLQDGVELDTCAIDQYWKRLQDKYKFYYYQDIYAGQLVGYSSIENRHVNYNERYLNQL
jgi:GR25 family glycosyltransferase involved in LPS biosynthesis